MKTTWSWSLESESNRLLQAAHDVGNGFYTSNHFVVLPDTLPYQPSTVHFPKLAYDQIPDFWIKVRSINTNILPVEDPHHLTPQLIPLLANYVKPDMSKLMALWDKHQKALLPAIYHELPDQKLLESLTIYETRFGTTGSFNRADPLSPHVVLFLRQDATLTTLVECLISSLLRPLHVQQGLNWRESEAIIDHITTNSYLSKILKTCDDSPYTGTLASLHTPDSHESDEFLAWIKAPSQKHTFTLVDDQPLVNNQPLHHLTSRETSILKSLIKLQGKTLSYDELSDLIFQSEEEYSLSVMGKAVERLRAKLEQNGVSGSTVGTDRSRGYFLIT